MDVIGIWLVVFGQGYHAFLFIFDTIRVGFLKVFGVVKDLAGCICNQIELAELLLVVLMLLAALRLLLAVDWIMIAFLLLLRNVERINFLIL